MKESLKNLRRVLAQRQQHGFETSPEENFQRISERRSEACWSMVPASQKRNDLNGHQFHDSGDNRPDSVNLNHFSSP